MARSRNIKPGFFLNEDLGTADPYLQLLFAGLWCLADKEGRLEDRPLRIKAEIFPYREGLEINGYLTELSRLNFIVRYSVGQERYIEIKNFAKHQNPHHTEKKSLIPASCEGTVNSPLKDGGNPADSLIPDSLIPDSGFLSKDLSTGKPADTRSPIPYQEIFDRYNTVCMSFAKAGITDARKNDIRLRWAAHLKHPSGPLAVFDELFKKAEASDFISGRDGKWTGRRGIDWLLNGKNMTKVLEGNYDNENKKKGGVNSDFKKDFLGAD